MQNFCHKSTKEPSGMTKNNNKKIIFSEKTGILPKIPKQERYKLIGQITLLMLSSEVHRKYLIDDIGATFLPAIHLNQFRLYKNNDGDPIGLVTWAFLSNDLDKKYQNGTVQLKLEDWKSGDNGWIIDFIAPFGHAKQIIKDLRSNIFANRQGKAIRVSKEGKIKGIWNLNGTQCPKNNKKPL
jgi:cytolysin-activating lysine-acyltransferase